jgi:hypothetical protein
MVNKAECFSVCAGYFSILIIGSTGITKWGLWTGGAFSGTTLMLKSTLGVETIHTI